MAPCRRAFVAAAAGVGLVALSGCLSDVTDRARGEATDRARGEVENRTGFDIQIPDDPPDADDERWRLYEFRAGERYEYRVETAEDGPGTFRWHVEDAGDDRLTIETDLTFENGETFARTVTGTEDEVVSELLATPAAIFVGSGLHSPHVGANEGVYVGYEWRFATSEGSIRYAVDETDSYLGIDCYVAVTEIDDMRVHESCLSPDLAFPAAVAYYDDDGTPLLEMELVEYDAGE
jgi:hypothetical protein